jgi:hypothetical protein
MSNVASWNGTMVFGIGGNFQNWATTGWSAPEAGITWIDGYQATLEFAMPAPQADQTLELAVLPVDVHIVQHMYTYLNGLFLGFVVGKRGLQEFTVTINQEFFRPDGLRNTLTFVCPKAVRPRDLGAGLDRRILSFAFSLLSLYPAKMPPLTPTET